MLLSFTEMHNQVETLLRSDLDRGTLLREFTALAQEDLFRHPDIANLWAIALYERDASFFEAFLLRHITDGWRFGQHNRILRVLLTRAEADGRDTLFRELYRRAIPEEEWNGELLALAQSSLSDEAVLQFVQRRDMRQNGFGLSEQTALTLYERSPSYFSSFIQSHIGFHRGMSNTQRGQIYRHLRDKAQQNGDTELYWHLFREFADAQEWKAELEQLLQQDLPPNQILPELERRHPRNFWYMDANILNEFIEKYGAVVLPYLEDNRYWMAHRMATGRHLAAIARLGEEIYWRIFFKVAHPHLWNVELRRLLEQPLSDEALLVGLQRRAARATNRLYRWDVEDDVAHDIYHRNPVLFRSWLEQHIQQPGLKLFQAAEHQNDDDFLNFLTHRLLMQLQSLSWWAFPDERSIDYYRKHYPGARSEYDNIAQALIARFDRLCRQSPALYVRHAANVLSRFEAHSIWSLQRQMWHNPVLTYLLQEQRSAWQQSSEAMRELLESPNIYVQIIGLAFLRAGSEDAARRVVENLPTLRALLLSRARINTKKYVLEALEQAARQGPEFAMHILPTLEETMDFRGKRAIGERIMVSFVRLRREIESSKG